jgi:CheY-like chemotaxis protein
MIEQVLSIDDDQLTLMFNEIQLKQKGFCKSIISKINGEEALHYLKSLLHLPEPDRRMPELILLDLNMPVMDGWEFLTKLPEVITAFNGSTHVVIFSSNEHPDKKLNITNQPFTAEFYPKPLSEKIINELRQSPHLSPYF